MKKFKSMIGFVLAASLFTCQAQAQDYYDYGVEPQSPAYEQSSEASVVSVALPLGALAVAAILIASTSRHHSSSSHSGGSYSYCCCHSHY